MRTVGTGVLMKGHIYPTGAKQGQEGSHDNWGPCKCLQLLVHVPPASSGIPFPWNPGSQCGWNGPLLIFGHCGEVSQEAEVQAAVPARLGTVMALHPEETSGMGLA